ncbi:ATP-binding cassette domain-containing protein [Pseudoflavonifractor sp. BIOML-A4]|nr:ATP-binding cassette domain-containing protein [Pseudoflavonifractor sp. BIOML-A4]
MIEVRELVKRYGGRLAVDGLSFTVESGQVYGFLGPNGAGKSTTMNMMTGYLGPTAGEVLVDGHSVADEPEEAKRRIGYLPEQPPLYTEMTVDEYLEFAAALKKVPRADRARQVDRAVERTRLGEVRRRLIRNLSKGYRQRVGIAQALLGDPEIIILDEPTVGLDPKQIIEIRALIRALAAEHTVILSSHILAEVQAVCGQILIIHRGRMVASGAPAELERRLAGSQALAVVVKGEEAAGRALLSALPGVRSVESVPGAEPGTAGFRVEPRAGEDLREAVFRACAAAERPLLGLRSGGLTLEEIFLKLTDDEEAVTENGTSGGGSGGDGEIPAAEDAADGEEEEA